MTGRVIWIVLLSLQPAAHDGESWAERVERMRGVAAAVHTASTWATCSGRFAPTPEKPCRARWKRSQKDLALLLVTLAWWESRLALNVHAGKCRPYECDATKLPDGRIYHRARTVWQLQRTGHVRRGEWAAMVGTAERPTGVAAVVASRVLGASLERCGSVTGAIAAYAGAGCRWKHAPNRALFWSGLGLRSDREHYDRMLDRARKWK